MKSKSDFWLTLHKLAYDLEQEGDGDGTENLLKVLESLPPATQRVYCSNLAAIMPTLSTLVNSCKGSGLMD